MKTFLKLIKIYGRFFVISLATVLGLTIYPEVGFSASDPGLQLSNMLAKPAASNATVSGSDAVGSLTGSFSVTPTGQAHYAIAIDVPPGTAKMQPAMSFVYDSSSSNTSNGLLGMGCSLEGLTAIMRCPSNKTQNGTIHGVDYTDSDRFCLNGDQLVAVKGTYGQDGTEYRTYNDTQARIISHGRQGNGPAYFTVDAKGGISAQYGMTTESQVKAQGKTSVAMWAVNRIKDTNGNYMDVHYYKDENIGSFYPTEVDYTGNEKTGMQPYNSMKFSYETRSDVIFGYQAGSKTTTDKRLSKVQTYQSSTLVSEYRLAYETSPNTYRSRMTSLQKCDGSGVCMPATKFVWQTNQNGWVSAPGYILPDYLILEGASQGRFADVNGDGLPDFIVSTSSYKATWLNNGNGWVSAPSYNLPSSGQFVDVNSDGLPDFIAGYPKNAWLNNGGGWVSAPNYILPDNLDFSGFPFEQFADLNGDGLPDFIVAVKNMSRGSWLNSGSGWISASNYILPGDLIILVLMGGGLDPLGQLVDVNGDGLLDFVMREYEGSNSKGSWLNNGSGWVSASNYILPGYLTYSSQRVGHFVDINGDGLPDFIEGYSAVFYKFQGSWFNSGNGWISAPNYILPALPMYEAQFVDVNGDGLADFLIADLYNNGATSKHSWLNSGNGWIETSSYNLPDYLFWYAVPRGQFVDLNGDGLPDFIVATLRDGAPTKGAWFNSATKLPDYMISVTDGLGSKLNITYAALSDAKYAATLYTKEHNATYPNQDVQGPMYVVAQTISDTHTNDQDAVQRVLAAASAKGIDAQSALSHITNYHYTGAKTNLLGLGSLGFHQVTTTDNSTGIRKTVTYGQDPTAHNVSQELSSETRLANSTLISSTQNKWVTVPIGTGGVNATYYRYYTNQVITKSYDLNGILMSTKSTTIDVDDYNNPVKTVASIIDSTGSYTTTTTNSYQNNIDTWLVGLLTGVTVTAEAPNQNAITHTASFINDPSTGMLLQAVVEPNDTKYQVATKYTRDAFGNITQTTVSGKDLPDLVTSATYDTYGRFASATTNPLGQKTSQIVDPRFGTISQTVDYNGLTTNYKYDSFGRLIETDYVDGTKATVNYAWSSTWSGAPTEAVYLATNDKTDGVTTTDFYDALNRPIAEATQGLNGELIWRNMQYDELGRVTKKTMPYTTTPYYVSYQYDVLGRNIAITYPHGKTTTVVYDGFTTTTTNTFGQRQIKTVNARGDLIKSTDNLSNSVTYTYDPFSKLVQMQDSSGNTTNITYDKYQHKIAIKDPDKGNWSFTYDVLGKLTSQTDSLQRTTTFQYDKLGRQISRTDAAATSTWEYDTAPHGVGKLAKVTSVAATSKTPLGIARVKAAQDGLMSYVRTYSYDELSRPRQNTTIVNDKSYTMTLTYDKDSRIDTETYPSGLVTQNHYNNLGFKVKIDNPQTKQMYWQLNALNLAGQVASETHGNGLITNYTYEPRTLVLTDIVTTLNQPLQIQKRLLPLVTAVPVKRHEKISAANASANSTAMQQLHYNFDAIGNVTDKNDATNNVNETFKYDALNRVTQATNNGIATTYQYDALGNIIYNSELGTYQYGQNGALPHAVTAINGGKTTASYAYDANGDQISGVINGVKRSINYTTYSKPLSITTPDASVNFFYDADHNLLARIDKDNSKTVTSLHLGDFEINTTEEGTKITTEQKHYIGSHTIYIKNSDGSSDAIYETLQDALGSITDITDASGNILQHFSYSPFGKQTQTKGAILDNPITHQGFTGQETIESMNLVHMGGRLYDPVIGRFLSADPTLQMPDNLQNLNRYSYGMNNPLHFIDYNGFGLISWIGDLIEGICNFICDVVKDICNFVSNLFSGKNIAAIIEVAVGIFAPALLPVVAAVMTAIHGGDFGDVLLAATMAYFTYAVNKADVWKYTGDMLQGADPITKVAVHGCVGGTLNAIEGGSFQDGFLACAAGEAAQNAFVTLGLTGTSQIEMKARADACGVVGGVAVALNGGNFMQGFTSAAYAQMYNDDNGHEQYGDNGAGSPMQFVGTTVKYAEKGVSAVENVISVVTGFTTNTLELAGVPNNFSQDLADMATELAVTHVTTKAIGLIWSDAEPLGLAYDIASLYGNFLGNMFEASIYSNPSAYTAAVKNGMPDAYFPASDNMADISDHFPH